MQSPTDEPTAVSATGRTRSDPAPADRAPAGDRRSPLAEIGRRAGGLLAVAALLFAMLLGLGSLLTGTDLGAAVGRFDVAVLQWLAEQRTPPVDATSVLLSDAASTTTVLVLGLVVAVVAAAVLRHWWPALLMTVALVGELVLFLNSAMIVGRARPPVAHLDPALPPTSSFPSGHTAAAICLYGGVAAIVLVATTGWWRWLVVAVAVLAVLAVAFARVYRAAHHPSDVLGAVLFAVPWLVATTLAVRPAPDRPGYR